jgi:hypothetical protein
MGPPASLPIRRMVCCGFLLPLKSMALAGFEPVTLGSSGKHTNHYTTKVTKMNCTHVWNQSVKWMVHQDPIPGVNAISSSTPSNNAAHPTFHGHRCLLLRGKAVGGWNCPRACLMLRWWLSPGMFAVKSGVRHPDIRAKHESIWAFPPTAVTLFKDIFVYKTVNRSNTMFPKKVL